MVILAIFSSPCGLNGAAINLGFTVQVLTRRGHQVHVLCRRPDLASAHLEQCGARTVFFDLPLGMNTTLLLESQNPPPWKTALQNLKDILRVVVGVPLTWRLVKALRPDVVFLMDVVFPQCALAAFATRVPVVCEAQEQLIRGWFGLRRRLVTAILGRCDRIFGITPAHVAPFADRGRAAGTLTVIPNSVTLPKGWQPAQSEALRDTTGRDVVLFCGGTNVNKGFMFALDVARELARRNPSRLLVFAGAFNRRYRSPHAAGTLPGSARETRYLFDYIRRHKLDDHVRVVGIRTDILDVMGASRVVLVPHRVPHFSRPIIEAFAVGTPVVASRDAFNADLIEDGKNGHLADYGNVGDWANGVEALLQSPQHAAALAGRARAVYRDRFSAEAVEPQLVELFESLAPA